MKKTYISPAITVIGVESSELMTVSGWTHDGYKEHGFGVVEEDETNGGYSDDDFQIRDVTALKLKSKPLPKAVIIHSRLWQRLLEIYFHINLAIVQFQTISELISKCHGCDP